MRIPYIHIIRLLFFVPIILVSCSKENNTENPAIVAKDTVTLQLSDKKATNETKALYSQLWKIQSKGFMFGHHDDLIYGRNWYTTEGHSDVKDVCGDYPAVFSVDFAEIMDDRNTTSDLNDDRKRCVLEARERGEVILACCHLNNPLTGKDAWDNSDNTVVSKILTDGSAVNSKFKSWLDNLAAFVSTLTDKNGHLIPVIFRPFHEHSQTWSWWGASCTTQQEFIDLWQFTVKYLRDTKGVHNFIYAISPQLDGMQNEDDLLFRWPGDDYVDFIGMDCYHGTYTAAFSNNLKNISLLSKEKKKPCGVTETGIEGIKKNDGSNYTNYWTNEILTPLIGRTVSMVVVWRNAYDPAGTGYHFYAPFSGQASSDNFIEFYKSSITFFSKDLPDMYTSAEGVTVK